MTFVRLMVLIFQGNQVFVGFTFAYHFKFVAIDEDFGCAAAGVVVAGHSEAISAGGENAEQVASFNGGQRPVFSEEVGAFADWTDDVNKLQPFYIELFSSFYVRESFFNRCRPDKMKRVVQRRPDEVVHTGIDDNEFFTAAFFEIKDLSEKYGRIGSDACAGFENELDVFAFEQGTIAAA